MVGQLQSLRDVGKGVRCPALLELWLLFLFVLSETRGVIGAFILPRVQGALHYLRVERLAARYQTDARGCDMEHACKLGTGGQGSLYSGSLLVALVGWVAVHRLVGKAASAAYA